MNANELTPSELRSLFSYDPESGQLTWRVSLSRRVRVGDCAGEITTNGYQRVRVLGRRYAAHRLIWFMVHERWPTEQIDHIDGDKTNNRIANLREATASQNTFNRKLPKKNATGFIGVTAANGSFEARIRVNGTKIGLGRFKQAAEAAAAYEAAAKKYFGEFARAA